jgi:potassium-transporting ATPase KdpC subunit
MIALLRPAFVLFALLTALTGLAYPAAVTGIARLLFPAQTQGSLVRVGDRVAGSALLGQPFTDARYFWGRPSATAPLAYNAAASAGSNQGPSNPALHDAVRSRIEALRAADPGNDAPVPVDLVTASASGLDPHVSPAAALYQAARVARARDLDESRVRERVARYTEARSLGVLGEPRVNVLLLNLDLDRLAPGGS